MLTPRASLSTLLPLVFIHAIGCAQDDGSSVDASTDGTDDTDGTDAGEGTGDDGVDSTGDVAQPSWTLFVYGHADHNLSPSLVADMLEMSQASLGENLRVIVAADWDASMDGYASGTEWYRILGDGQEPELLDTVAEQDLDDPQVLRAAIVRAFTENPADHFGLLMWNHGGSWQAGFGGDSANGSGHGAGISAPALAAAIGDALAEAGVERLRFLSFDTCLMAGVEVLAELAPLSELYIANAEIDYGAGWDYNKTLTWLGAHPETDTAGLAEAEAGFWDTHHATMGAEDALLRSHTAIDPSAIPAFLEAFAAFNEAFRYSSAVSGLEVGRAAYFSLPGYWAESLTSLAQAPNLRDVGQFLAAMGEADGALGEAALAASTALDAAVLQTVNGEVRAPLDQIGVHIELPPALEVPWRLEDYPDRAPTWVGATQWDDGLFAFSSLADASAPVVITDLETEPGNLVLFVEDADVAAVDIQLAAIDPEDPDRVRILGLIGSGAIDPGIEYVFAWDGHLLQLGAAGQGQAVAVFPFARLGKTEGDALPILAVPGRLVGFGEEVEAVLPFQVGDTYADSIVVQLEAGQTAVIPMDYAAGYQFIPLVPELSLRSGEQSTAMGGPIDIPTSGGLPLSDAPAPAGDYLLVTTAFDVWGNFDPVVDPAVLR